MEEVSEENQNSMKEEEQEDFDEKIRVAYFCPGSLYSVIGLSNGLFTKAAQEIEQIISQNKIKEYTKN